MPLTTNNSPFWDDYADDKQFYRILFRPGYAVQARELTQLQTNLQKQIERQGKHSFTHGSRILDGELAYNKCDHIKLSEYIGNDPNNNEINVWAAYSNTALTGIKVGLDATTAGDYGTDDDGEIYVTDADGTIRKPVAQVVFASGREASDPPTLLINYESGDKFSGNDYITKIGSPAGFPDSFSAVVNTTVTLTGSAVGRASYASIATGIYFVTVSTGGYFAYVPKQKIVLDKYSASPTYKIGFNIVESIVTPEEDGTLYDNAQGTYTTYAPGAHRLKVALDFSKAPGSDGTSINPASAKDFVELMRIENGQRAYATPGNQEPIRAFVEDEQARRTYDESGNFVIDDFDCRVEDIVGGDRVKVIVGPMKGKTSSKAYIRGHLYEQGTPWVEYIERARKTAILPNVTTPLNHGAITAIKDLAGQAPTPGTISYFDTGRLPVMDIHSVNTFAVDTDSIVKYNSTKLGHFRIRDIIPITANTHAIYITDFEGSHAITGNCINVPVESMIEGNGADGIRLQSANTSDFNNAYIGGKLTITYSHYHPEFVGQSRTIVKSDNDIGTDTIVYLNAPFNQPSANNEWPGSQERYVLSLDLRAAATGNGCIVASGVNDFTTAVGAATGGVIGNKEAANGNISQIGTVANSAILGGGTHPGLIFKMPVGGARMANGISYGATGNNITYYAKYSQTDPASSGTAAFPITALRNQSSGWASAGFATRSKRAMTVINETTGKVIDPDDWTLDAGSTPSQITIDSPFISGSQVVRLIAPVKITALNPKRKTLSRGSNLRNLPAAGPVITNLTTNNHVVIAAPNQQTGNNDSLGVPDVYRIIDVYDSGEINLAPTYDMINNSDYRVTANYELDHGQSEDLYDYSSIVLKASAPAPLGQLAVVFDKFNHTDTDKSGFFTVDSYAGQVAIDNITRFISTKTGQRYDLREYIDFRPSRRIGAAASVANTNYFVPIYSAPDLDHTVSNETVLHPDSQGNMIYDMQYFAPRFDKIVLSLNQTGRSANTGFIKIVSGTDDIAPAIPPTVDPADMTLFQLALPSYTPKARDISILKTNNRRWTMKDISKMDGRIDRLEYYSSLSLMEQDLNDLNIMDASGNLERFKHGFLVDTFYTGLALADIGIPGVRPNPDFQAAIGKGVLRPAVETENISLNFDEALSQDIISSSGVMHLPYTTVYDSDLQQVRATGDGAENINPFQIQNFRGTVTLSPTSDIWKSVIDAGEVHLDTSGEYDLHALEVTLNDIMGPSMTQWGEWETDWYGEVQVGDTIYSAQDPTGAFDRVMQEIPFGLVNQLVDQAGTGNLGHATDTGYENADDLTNLVTDLGTTVIKDFDVPGTDWRTYREKFGEDEHSYQAVPLQTHIFDDEIATVYKTATLAETRQGTEYTFNVTSEQVEVGEFVVNTNLAPYMRPIDISFRVHGLKPTTVMYPSFDDVDIRPYTERANELVLRHNDGVSAAFGVTPFSSATNNEDLLYSGAIEDGIGLVVGNYGNTHFIVNANGMFNVGDIVSGTISTGQTRTVVSYKHYSGTVQNRIDARTITIDNSAATSESWYTTEAPGVGAGRAKDKPGGSPGVDLYGKTIYITEGRGYGQSRTISSYSNVTNQLIVSSDFSEPTPNTQSRYSISDHKTTPAGQLFGVFHVPNYNWANLLLSKQQEGDPGPAGTQDLFNSQNATSDEQTSDLTRFLVGNKSFQVRDSSDKYSESLHSFGIGTFRASGVIETRATYTMDVMGIETITNSVTDSRITTTQLTEISETGRQIEVGTICHLDPLAQSFLVDPHKYPEGIFIDSVDIWFATKPDSSVISDSNRGLPVNLQIRPTIGGVPHGGHVLGRAIRYPTNITVSSGGLNDLPSTANNDTITNFKFDYPVYLAGGNEFAVVLLSDSIEYEVWTAKVGASSVGTGGETGIPAVTIDSQPHLGSLFKSQNGTTWQPEVNQDMMFRLHKCKFDPTSVGTAIWKTSNAMTQYTPPQFRVHNPLAHVNLPSGVDGLGTPSTSTSAHKFYSSINSEDGGASPNGYLYHRFRVDSSTLDFPSGFTTFSYAAATKADIGVPNPLILNPFDYSPLQLHQDTVPSNTLKLLNNKTGSFLLKGIISTVSENISPMINLERLSLTMIRNLINDGNLYANTWPTNFIATDDYAGGNNIGGGFYIESAGGGYSDQDTINIEMLPGAIGIGAIGKPIINGTSSIVGVTLSNVGNTYLHSPNVSITTTTGTGAVIKYHGEDEPAGPGNFLARYMTKKVILLPGAEATDIKIYLTASQPRGTRVWVYSKVKNISDIEPFEKKRWKLMSRNQGYSAEVTPSADIFREIRFSGPGTDPFPLTYETQTADGSLLPQFGAEGTESGNQPSAQQYNTFNQFAIKIVMQSNDPLIVPIVSDLRAIAVE